MRSLYASVTNLATVESIVVSEAHNSGSNSAQIITTDSSPGLGIGDAVVINMGYSDDHAQVFAGTVKDIRKSTDGRKTTIVAYDVINRAIDYFIASNTPDDPFTRSNISAEDLVEDILNLAGITSYTYDPTSFVFGTVIPIKINLEGAYDSVKTIADTLAWHIWADRVGQVHFEERKPYPMSGKPSVVTLANDTILNLTNNLNVQDLRNRIVIYGIEGITANASAYSPYTDVFKTAVLSTSLIDTQVMAQQTANYNLALYNRLTQTVTGSVLGDTTIEAHKELTVVNSELGLSKQFYIYAVEHSWSREGYVCNLTLKA